MEEFRPQGYYLGCIHCKSCNLLKPSLQPIPILTSFTNTVINLICITVPELVEWRVVLVRTNQRLAAQRFSVNYPVMSGSNYSTYSSLGFYGNSALFLKRSQYISLDFYVLRKSQKAKVGFYFSAICFPNLQSSKKNV